MVVVVVVWSILGIMHLAISIGLRFRISDSRALSLLLFFNDYFGGLPWLTVHVVFRILGQLRLYGRFVSLTKIEVSLYQTNPKLQISCHLIVTNCDELPVL